MKYLKTVLLSAATLALSFTSSTVVAQDAPAVKYIAQTTSEFVMPDGVTREEVQKTFQEYFDKVISKSTIVKHYNMYIHAWGSLCASYVTTLGFDSWADMDKFGDEFDKLEKAAWPDEAVRKAFLKKLGSYSNPHHRDEIFTVMTTMRK